MDRGQLFNGLEFNNDCATHHQIGTKTVVEGDALIYEADALLTLDLQSAALEFVRQVYVVHRLQQARPACAMNPQRCVHDLPTDHIDVHMSFPSFPSFSAPPRLRGSA
jgi:hypothetical protein